VREDASGDKRIVAYLEAPERHDLAFNLEGLGDFLRRKLPHYMVPDAFVVVDLLPMRNDKLDRRRLQEVPLSRVTRRQHISPTNATQILLAQIWEELLGTQPIGILDDFFDLGGHSLLAFAMLARLEEVFGRKLPIGTLYNSATIHSLSLLFTDDPAEVGESPLALVQAGKGKRPFFFLHGDFNGGGFYCRNLARHLDPDQPFQVIHPFGLAGQPAPVSMEDMAAEHLKLVRAVQPEGPYLLGGHCNGALEAYEMAQQLHAAGQKVGLLLLIDPPPAPNPEQPRGRKDDSLNQPDLAALPKDQRQQLLLRLFALAIERYRPRPYRGPVSLLRSEERPGSAEVPIDGWSKLIPGMELFNFAGGHLSTITRNVAEIGKRIQLCLDGSRDA
jgi:thioesterase domain-containing protein/acyl carrier protein